MESCFRQFRCPRSLSVAVQGRKDSHYVYGNTAAHNDAYRRQWALTKYAEYARHGVTLVARGRNVCLVLFDCVLSPFCLIVGYVREPQQDS